MGGPSRDRDADRSPVLRESCGSGHRTSSGGRRLEWFHTRALPKPPETSGSVQFLWSLKYTAGARSRTLTKDCPPERKAAISGGLLEDARVPVGSGTRRLARRLLSWNT